MFKFELTRFIKEKNYAWTLVLISISIIFAVKSIDASRQFDNQVIPESLNANENSVKSYKKSLLVFHSFMGEKIVVRPNFILTYHSPYSSPRNITINTTGHAKLDTSQLRELSGFSFNASWILLFMFFILSAVYGSSINFSIHKSKKFQLILIRGVILFINIVIVLSFRLLPTIFFKDYFINHLGYWAVYTSIISAVCFMFYSGGVFLKIYGFERLTELIAVSLLVITTLIAADDTKNKQKKVASENDLQVNKTNKVSNYQEQAKKNEPEENTEEYIHQFMKKYLEEYFYKVKKDDFGFIKSKRKLEQSSLAYSIISPIAYLDKVEYYVSHGSPIVIIEDILKLEKDFCNYLLPLRAERFSNREKKIACQVFFQGNKGIYTIKASLPYNWIIALLSYIGISFIMSILIVHKLKKTSLDLKIAEELQNISIPSLFTYISNLSQDQRDSLCQQYAEEYFLIKEVDSIAFPQDMTFTDIFILTSEEHSHAAMILERTGYNICMGTKIRDLDNYVFKLIYTVLSTIKNKKVVISNIAAIYQDSIREQFTQVLEELTDLEYEVIYLSSTTHKLKKSPARSEQNGIRVIDFKSLEGNTIV